MPEQPVHNPSASAPSAGAPSAAAPSAGAPPAAAPSAAAPSAAAPSAAAPSAAAPTAGAPQAGAPSAAAPSAGAPSAAAPPVDRRAPISAAAVRERLAAPARWAVAHTASTGSTNADLLAAPPPPAGVTPVLITEEQVRGRGRAGRVWTCPAGAGLMMSIALHRPPVPPDRRGWAGAALGMSIVDALTPLLPDRRVGLKWPNDVLVDGEKIAGILGEAGADTVVVGAGINVTLGATELPRPDATSLVLSGAAPAALDRAELAAAVLDALGPRLDRWFTAGGDVDASGIRQEYRHRSATLGRAVRLEVPGGAEIEGEAVDVTADGAVLVRTADGRERAWTVAQVTHLRPGR